MPTALDNNDVFNITYLYYAETHFCTTIVNGAFHDTSYDVGTGNVSVSASFVNRDGGDWHLQSSSPDEVKYGGKNITDPLFPGDDDSNFIDKDGNIRTIPWSIGAYEFD